MIISSKLTCSRQDIAEKLLIYVVTLIEKRGNGWWKGKIKDKEGWFPGSYVEETEIGKGNKTWFPVR
jgi:hypothetical protein